MDGVGHNSGAVFDEVARDNLDATADEFLIASQKWIDMSALSTDIQAAQLTDQIDGLRGLMKKVEDARKADKKPHADAAKAVDDAYRPVTAKLQTCMAGLKKLADSWLQLKRAQAENERRQREADARAKQEAADRAAAEAAQGNDLAAQIAAERAAKEAEEAQKAADAKIDTSMRSMSGAGRTISTRTQRTVVIKNVRQLFLHYQDHPRVMEVLQSLAQADVRAKDVDHTQIPGIRIEETEVAV